MATIEGAQAVGLGDEVGSLEAGKQADLILVDLTELNLSPVLEAPVRNLVPNLVYAGSGHEVKTVMVARQVLVREGKVLIADEAALRLRVMDKEWHKQSLELFPMSKPGPSRIAGLDGKAVHSPKQKGESYAVRPRPHALRCQVNDRALYTDLL